MTPILQWCLSFPEWVLRPFAGRSEVIDGQVLDVDAQLVLRVMRRMPSVGADGALPVAEARQAFRRVPKYVRRAWRRPTEDVVIPLAGRDLPARIYRAESAEGEQAPVLLWFHGGGWVIGDLETAEVVCHQLSTFGGFDVVSVDYRLAPEHPYPAAADDAIESADWIAEHGHQWGLRSGSVSVSGDSAGGNLAAVASLYSDHVCAQLDVYGGVDLSHGKASKTLFADGYLLTARGVDWFGAQYWPDPTRKAEPKASPLLADDLSSMPPAVVVVAGFDPIRDDSYAYIRALTEAGVDVVVHEWLGQAHGFFTSGDVLPTGRDAVQRAAVALRQLVDGCDDPELAHT